MSRNASTLMRMATSTPSGPATPSSGVRAQLLATEHAGLLAARSTAQSEVLTRISIFLTLFSASLVSIAFIGQATGFGELFGPSAIAVLVIVTSVGQLTQIRVVSIGIEDLMYVLALNRIRAAWVALDPGVAPYLLSSPHDDRPGSVRTYDFFGTRSPMVQVGGSSMVLIMVVNAMLLGLLAAAICLTAGAPNWVTITVGVLVAAAFLVASVLRGQRTYFAIWERYVPLNPTP
jgi:hypothetical protein